MTTSTEVLAIMKAIEKNLDDLTGRVASIDKYMDPTNPSSLKRARDDLEEIGEALTTSLDYQEVRLWMSSKSIYSHIYA
jgi:uncharacterized protein YaaR (DUF327 family)